MKPNEIIKWLKDFYEDCAPRVIKEIIEQQQAEIKQLQARLGEMKTAYDEMHKPYYVEATGQQASQIIDLLAKKDQGLLIELPCKVGTPCFYVGFNGMSDTCYIQVEKYEVGMYDCGTVFLNLDEAIQCVISVENIEHLKTDKEILERKQQLRAKAEQALAERENNG